MIKQIALVLAAAAGTASMGAAPYQARVKAHLEQQAKHPMRYARQLKSASAFDPADMNRIGAQQRVAPSKQLPQADVYSFLDGPKGAMWMCTYNFEVEKVQYEYYTETLYKGVTVTVYNDKLEVVGEVTDHFPLSEGQTRVAQIMVDPSVTQKFFNSDSQYEICLMVAYNKPDYTVDTKTYAYSVGATKDSEGNTPRIAEFDGYITAAVDASTSRWSEDYYMTFVTESDYNYDTDDFAEFVASQKIIAKTFKKASYNGAPEQIGETAISVANLPGDMMSCPFMLTTVVDGKPMFVVQQYEKWFFNNAIGPMGDSMDNTEGMPTEDNNLIVDVYTYPGMGAEWILDHTTKVPCVQTDPIADVVFRYYGLGNLTYNDDYRPDGSLRMSIFKYRLSDDDNYLQTYVLFDKDGHEMLTLAENASSFMLMNDVEGFEPQVMFIDQESTEASAQGAAAMFYFVDLESGMRTMEMPNLIGGYSTLASVDRVPYGNSYRYAFETSKPDVDADGNVICHVVWVNPEGELVRVDAINIGPRVALAKAYMDQAVLNPYLFDTDEAQEYLWLVKRYTDNTGSDNTTELVIVSPEKTLLTLKPDEVKGDLRTISAIFTDTTNPLLWVSYADSDDRYTQDFYSLPFNTLQGEGTEANPYKIASLGDFALIGANPNASYVLTADLDGSQTILNTVPGYFYGTLDGAGHSINNLTIGDQGSIFTDLGQGAVVKNLYINNVKINTSATTCGTIAAYASGATIDNVHILGLTINHTGSVTFGGIVGGGYLGTVINNSSVSAANIVATDSFDLGGIVADMRTAATVTACSFAGSIKGNSSVGGIVGSMNSDNIVSDCHVDADIQAVNLVGGIAGYFSSGLITRCYVEGSITAVGNPDANYDFGPQAGGILGQLRSESSVLSATEVEYVVKDNLVNLTSLKGYTPQKNDNTTATIHRIVGRTIFNEATDEGEKAWGADPRMTNNYAVASLPAGDDAVEATDKTTEGASVAASALNQDWFKNSLGFTYGDTGAWNESTDADPALNHEQLNVCVPSKVTAMENTKFTIGVLLAGREIYTEQTAMEQFSYECDETYLMPTGVFSLVNNLLQVEFEAYKQGEVPVTLCGAKCMVTITENLGVDAVVSDADTATTIRFIGSEIVAADAFIKVFNLQGVAVASGFESVSTATLTPGVYVAVANNATLKFLVK